MLEALMTLQTGVILERQRHVYGMAQQTRYLSARTVRHLRTCLILERTQTWKKLSAEGARQEIYAQAS